MASTSPSLSLAQGTCEPCKKGSEPLSVDAISALLTELNSEGADQDTDAASGPQDRWTIVKQAQDGAEAPSLVRTFLFRNFKYALAFTNAVGEIAEREGHHPALLTEWGSVRVAWWTHAIGGLHRNDFILAAKTNEVFSSAEGKKRKKTTTTTAAQ